MFGKTKQRIRVLEEQIALCVVSIEDKHRRIADLEQRIQNIWTEQPQLTNRVARLERIAEEGRAK